MLNIALLNNTDVIEKDSAVLLGEAVGIIEELVDHLDYCGWGRDEYEREVAKDLPERAQHFMSLHRQVEEISVVPDHNLADKCPVCGKKMRGDWLETKKAAVRQHMKDKHGIVCVEGLEFA
jgi:hypothetical protein